MPKKFTLQEADAAISATWREYYARGYALAMLEERFSPGAARGELQRPESETHPYVSKTTVAEAEAIALDYLKEAAPRTAGPTEILKNTKENRGITISYTSLGRALLRLMAKGKVEKTSSRPPRWRHSSP